MSGKSGKSQGISFTTFYGNLVTIFQLSYLAFPPRNVCIVLISQFLGQIFYRVLNGWDKISNCTWNNKQHSVAFYFSVYVFFCFFSGGNIQHSEISSSTLYGNADNREIHGKMRNPWKQKVFFLVMERVITELMFNWSLINFPLPISKRETDNTYFLQRAHTQIEYVTECMWSSFSAALFQERRTSYKYFGNWRRFKISDS